MYESLPVIRLHNIEFAYGKHALFRYFSLEISRGEFVGLIGPNGAGKTTLLKIMGGMVLPSRGDVWLADRPVRQYRRKELAQILTYVPQEFASLYDFTVEEIVCMGRFPYHGVFEPLDERDWHIVEAVMTRTGVQGLRLRRLSQLSGGEKQRVILASALAQEPQVLLLDEPTRALDVKHQLQFYHILQQEQRQSRQTVVTVTHDINLAVRFCQRILVLQDGRLIADGPPEKVISPPVLEAVYQVPVEIFPHPADGKPLVVFKGVAHGQ